jgi:phosphoglucomutase
VELEGAAGLERAQAMMAALRADPPATLLGRPVAWTEDVQAGVRHYADGREEASALPRADVVVVQGDGARVVVRPSGTEPKLKVYLEVVGADPAGPALGRLRDEVRARLS